MLSSVLHFSSAGPQVSRAWPARLTFDRDTRARHIKPQMDDVMMAEKGPCRPFVLVTQKHTPRRKRSRHRANERSSRRAWHTNDTDDDIGGDTAPTVAWCLCKRQVQLPFWKRSGPFEERPPVIDISSSSSSSSRGRLFIISRMVGWPSFARGNLWPPSLSPSRLV